MRAHSGIGGEADRPIHEVDIGPHPRTRAEFDIASQTCPIADDALADG